MEILQGVMGQPVNLYMEKSLLMRTLILSILDLENVWSIRGSDFIPVMVQDCGHMVEN